MPRTSFDDCRQPFWYNVGRTVFFVNADDAVAYLNRLGKTKIFPRTRSVIGRQVEKCHPEHSVDTVRKIVSVFKVKTLDNAVFWIDFKNDKILIR